MHGVLQLASTKANHLAHDGIATRDLVEHALLMATRSVEAANLIFLPWLDRCPVTQQMKAGTRTAWGWRSVRGRWRLRACSGCGLSALRRRRERPPASRNQPERAARQTRLARSPARSGKFSTNTFATRFRSNLSLQSQSLEVERNLARLDAARGRFFPKFSFAARYSRAEGGREIDVPLGLAAQPHLLVAQRPARRARAHRLVPDSRAIRRSTSFASASRTRGSPLRQPIYAPAIPAAVRAQRARARSLANSAASPSPAA